MEGRAWWMPQLSSYVTLAGKVLGINILQMAVVTSCVCERAKSRWGRFCGKRPAVRPDPSGEPGWSHAPHTLNRTCGSRSSCGLGAGTSRTRERRAVWLSKDYIFPWPALPSHFLLRNVGFIGGVLCDLIRENSWKRRWVLKRGKNRANISGLKAIGWT